MIWSPHRGLSRSHVAWSSELPAPVMSCRNFGDDDRDMGHSRVPEPPAGITAHSPSIAEVSRSSAILAVVLAICLAPPAPSAMAETVQGRAPQASRDHQRQTVPIDYPHLCLFTLPRAVR